MKEHMDEQYIVSIPYAELGIKLLECIFASLEYLINVNIEEFSDDELEGKIENCFHSFYILEPDFHISKNNNNRLSKIVLTAYKNVQEVSKSKLCIPSPLNILYQMLTVAHEPQSVAYVIIFCRSLLFETFNIFQNTLSASEYIDAIHISKVSECIDAIQNRLKKPRKITEIKPRKITKIKDNIYLLLLHYLALKGVFYLKFDYDISVSNYLKSKKISAINNNKLKIEFKKFTYYNNLPDVNSIMNELIGIPVPLRGMDIIFQGGLRPNSKSNIMMRISGQPGSGKTSLALSLAAVMSPLGTSTHYISLEEDEEELKDRLHSLIPEYLKKLSIYEKNINLWFRADKISISDGNNKLDKFIDEYFDKIYKPLEIRQELQKNNYLPIACPLLIVIDSILPFIENAHFERFVSKCKELKAFIIILSPSVNENHSSHDIDYMIDVVVNLKYEGTDSLKEKPLRIFQLLKTRRQASRNGSHLFHFSNTDGLYFVPQLPSQIDKKEIISKLLPSDTYFINFFNEYNEVPNEVNILQDLKISTNSQVLIHGYESTGKAGLALAMLLYPVSKREEKRRKVLIVSLLYDEAYYKKLEKKIKETYDKINETANIDCICFYSGYISPESFVSKIIRKLDCAILEGDPFTGILLDGLHNAILQFPKLQESDMIWPAFYSILAKYHLTNVTTFTEFKIDKGEISKNSNDVLKSELNLLNMMYQSADYTFLVEKLNDKKNVKYTILLESAINHRLKNDKFYWSRENLSLYIDEPKPQPQLSLLFSDDDDEVKMGNN